MLPEKQNSFYDLIDNEALANQFADNNQQQKLLMKFPYYQPQSFLYYPFSTQYFTDQFNYPMPMINQQPQLEVQKVNDSIRQFPEVKQQQPIQKQKKAKKIEKKSQQFLDKVQVEMKLEKKQAQNLKNTYINKISQLISQETNNAKDSEKQLYDKYKKQISLGDSKQKTQDNESDQKLVRNRECARNSRKRKKIYIELLENKVKDMVEEINHTKVLHQKNGQNINIFDVEENENFFLNFIEAEDQLTNEIEKLLSDEPKAQFSQLKSNININCFREQLSNCETARRKAENFMMQQFLNVAIPTHQKYLIKSKALCGSDSVNQQLECEDREWEKKLFHSINQTEEQRQKLQKMKPQLSNEVSKLESQPSELFKIWKQLTESSRSLSDIISEMSEQLSDRQIAVFLNFCNKLNIEEVKPSKLFSLEDKHFDEAQQNGKKSFINDQPYL